MILQDGFRTLVSFNLNPNLSIWQKRIKPWGFDAGGGINTSSMRNASFHTMFPKTLIKITDLTIAAAYDPNLYPEYMAISRLIAGIITTYPDSAILTVYGWLDKIEPSEHTEGEQPMMTLTAIAANTGNAFALVGFAFTPGTP